MAELHVHTRVEADAAHPDGAVRLWVKDKHVNLTVDEAFALAAALTVAAESQSAAVPVPTLAETPAIEAEPDVVGAVLEDAHAAATV